MSNLRFADDVVLISNDTRELSFMLEELTEPSSYIGLEVNWSKTKIMSQDVRLNITIGNTPVEIVDEYTECPFSGFQHWDLVN